MNETQSIWIIKQYAVTPDMPGNTRHFELGRRLVQRGYDVTIFATSFHYSQHRDLRLRPEEYWKAEKIEGVKFVWLRTFPFYKNDWRRALHMLSFMYRAYRVGKKPPKLNTIIPAPDLIIGCSVPPFAALAGYWLSRHYGSRFFFEVGDLWPQTLIDMGALSERNPITMLLQRLERFLYQRAERILTPLPHAHTYIQERGIPLEKIVWLPNGADTQSFNTYSRTAGLDQQFTVVYAGVHGRAQGLETILQAAKVIQEQNYEAIRFVLIGDGPEKPKLRALAGRLQLDNVEFKDSIPKSEMPRVLGEAAAVIFPLRDAPTFRKYGVGSKKLFDYLAAGVPLIFAVRSANNPVEEVQCGVTVEPGDPDAMAQAVIELYRLPEGERRAMGERGRQYVQTHHDWSVLADHLQALIEQRDMCKTEDLAVGKWTR